MYVLLSVWLLVQFAWSEELTAGKTYLEGSKIEVSSLGVSFSIPPQWLGGLVPDGDGTIIFGSNTEGGMLMTLSTQHASLSKILAQFRESIPLGDGLVLVPQGEPKIDNEHVVVEYTVTKASVPTSEAFGRLEGIVKGDGRAFGVLAVGATTAKAQLVGRQQSLIASTQFYTPVVSSKLVGCWLNTDGFVSDGFSSMTSTQLILDGQGRYQYSSKSSASLSTVDSQGDWMGDSTAENSDGVERGMYYTIGNFLILQVESEERIWQFDPRNGSMYFNGTRYSSCG